MSQSLTPAWQQSGAASPTSRSTRRLERSVFGSLERMGAQQVLDVARIRAQEDCEIEAIHAIEGIADAGVMSAAMVLSKARLLMDMSPMDAGLIQGIAQIGGMAIADRVRTGARRIG
jgi:hypothetical protein